MEYLEEELDLDILNDCFGDSFLSTCELLDLDVPSPRTASQAPGPCTEEGDSITMYASSSLRHESSKCDSAKVQEDTAARKRELLRIRQQRFRQKRKEHEKIQAEKLEYARNSIRKIEEENKKIEQENRAMSCFVETATSMLQKTKLAVISSISYAPYQKILLILEGLAAFRAFDHRTDLTYDTFMERVFLTFGAHAIIRTVSLFLSKSQFGKVIFVPILRTCKLVMEWCDHPAKRSEIEAKLKNRFHRMVAHFKAIRDICPEILEATAGPAEDVRNRLKEECLAHLNHEDLVKATRLSEEQKKKMLQAWREYQNTIYDLNALVSSSTQLLATDCKARGVVVDKAISTAEEGAFVQATNPTNLTLMALGNLHSFQKRERQAYFDLTEATFVLTPLQWFRLRLLALCLSENKLHSMYLAIQQMS